MNARVAARSVCCCVGGGDLCPIATFNHVASDTRLGRLRMSAGMKAGASLLTPRFHRVRLRRVTAAPRHGCAAVLVRPPPAS
ncbi:hypothetical protein NQZ68_025364 [Dissostichus eleginoides]|nr:hypothetical protein NQZ68_025364 [Dissostichus eleginoides]